MIELTIIDRRTGRVVTGEFHGTEQELLQRLGDGYTMERSPGVGKMMMLCILV